MENKEVGEDTELSQMAATTAHAGGVENRERKRDLNAHQATGLGQYRREDLVQVHDEEG